MGLSGLLPAVSGLSFGLDECNHPKHQEHHDDLDTVDCNLHRTKFCLWGIFLSRVSGGGASYSLTV